MAKDPYAHWWRRLGTRRFRLVDAQGAPVHDARPLYIPPGWSDVRVAPSPASRIQAVGLDKKGRRQYVYHPAWVARREAAKLDRLVRFGQARPRFRAVTEAHLAAEGLGPERVLALVAHLLDAACFRTGGERYRRAHGSHGVSTLRVGHVEIGASALWFRFRGKHGVRQRQIVVSPALAALTAEVAALPGPRLFQYVRADGAIAPVTGKDLNAYVQAVVGPGFTAKDFRTWGATARMARCLAAQGPAPTLTAARKAIKRCLAATADHLGNTPAICRASYVSPKVIAAYERGRTLADFLPEASAREALYAAGHTAEEIALMAMLAAEG